MSDLASELEALSGWSSLGEDDRRRVALSIIDRFEAASEDVDAIVALAKGLAASGDLWSWPSGFRPTGDVVSTGGPSSLTTLLCPYIIAASGCYVPKVSVPGSTAGALDVLGLIEGFRTDLSHEDARRALASSRIAHTASTSSVAPADGYLFRLRKKIAKKSIPPIVIASLLSKKIAVSCGSSAVDLRCGVGGNMGAHHQACGERAALFARAAELLGLRTSCVVTDIGEPQNPFIGRSESLYALTAVLSGNSSDPWLSDHVETCICIAAEAVLAAKLAKDGAAATRLARTALTSGKAQAAFYANLEAQGAEVDALEAVLASYWHSSRRVVRARRSGYIVGMANDQLAHILARVNGSVPGHNDRLGIYCVKRRGERVEAGEPLLEFRLGTAVNPDVIEAVAGESALAFEIADHPPEPSPPQIIAVVRNFETGEGNGRL